MQILNAEQHTKIHEWLMIGIAFSLPFDLRINTWFILGALGHLILNGNLKEAFNNARTNRYVVFLFCFFFMFVAAYFLSQNKKEAWSMIERRAAFVAIPLLFYGYCLPENTIIRIQKSFVYACLTSFVICVVVAANKYFYWHNTDFFYYHQLTAPIGMNAVYMSAYTLLAGIILQQIHRHYSALQLILMAVLLAIYLILLSSKLMLILAVPVLLIPQISKINKFKYYMLIAAMLALVTVIILLQPTLRNRFGAELNAPLEVVKANHFRYDTPFSGTTLRLLLWRYSFELLAENNAWIWGVGSGDFQDLLNQKYKSNGLYTGNVELADTGYLGYGPHNTYIETMLSMGIIGLLTLVYFIYLYGKMVKQSSNVAGIQFLVLFCSFFVTESVLSVNKGIVAFVFFAVLFAVSKIKYNTAKV